MGVDLASYRVRIGCYRHNHGTDVTRLTVTINATMAAKIACFIVPLGMCFLYALFCVICVVQETEVVRLGNIKLATSLLYANWYLCRVTAPSIESIVGAVSFIHLLLLAAGIESNPGPELTTYRQHWQSPCLNEAISSFADVFFSWINCHVANEHRGTQQFYRDNQCLCFDDNGYETVISSNTCCYLLGNKGVHMTNGNPHDKGTIIVSDSTRSLLEKGVQESIGYISIDRRTGDDIIPNDDFFDHGTGFRVGDRYMMTAYHVFRKKIYQLVDMIIICVPTCTPDLLRKLDLDEHQTEMTKETAINKFIEKNALDIPQLLSRLDSIVGDKVSEFKTEEWKKNCVVDFVNHGRFTVDWNIPFGLAERDFVILPLLKTAENQHMPKPLFLEEHCEELFNVHLVRYITEDNPRIELDAMCKLYDNDEELAHEVDEAIEWWASVLPEKADRIRDSYSECRKAQNKDTGLIILRAAASFVEGSSGSPLVYLKSGQPFAGMVYQRGFPRLFYREKEELEEKIKASPNQNIDNKVLFEGCTTIENVAKSLTTFKKQNLKRDIFNEQNVKRHILKDKVREDIKQNENYDVLFTKATLNTDQQNFGLSELLEMKRLQQPKEYMVRVVKQWETEDKYFVDTVVTRHIKHTIEKSNIVTIVGVSGSGKSFSMRHTALELQKQGYSLFVISECSEMKDFLGPSSYKQIFLFDDPIGEGDIDQQKLNELKHHFEHIMGNCKGSTKLVMTMRTELMNTVDVKDLNLSSGTEIIELHSTKLQLTPSEKHLFFLEALTKRNIRVSSENPLWKMVLNCDLQNYALLVHMYCTDEYFRKNPSELFTEPLGAFESRLQRMWASNSRQFGGLVLCAVTQAKVHSGMFDPFDCRFQQYQDKAKEFLKNLGIDTNLSLLAKELEKLKGIYIIKDKTYYEFKHSAFRNIVSYVVAKRHNAFIVTYCNSNFCLERCILSRGNAYRRIIFSDSNDRYKIEVNEHIEECVAFKFVKSFEENQELVSDIFNSHFCHDRVFLRRILLAIQATMKDDQFKMDVLYQVFCNACLFQGHDTIEELMNMFLDLNDHSFTGLTPLIACTFRGDIKRIRFLLSKGVGVNVLGTGGYNIMPLSVASYRGFIDIIKLFLTFNVDVNALTGLGTTALTNAVLCNNIDVVKLLLDNKADINLYGSGDQACPPLTMACVKGFANIVQLLFKYNVNVNVLTGKGTSSLTEAILKNHIDVVKLLLDNKADINLCGVGDHAYTPLTAACERGNINIINMLLKCGVDINLLNGLGRTPLTHAVGSNHIDVVQLLLDKEADTNLCGIGNKAYTPLAEACLRGFEDIIHLLLRYDVEIDHLNGIGTTPLVEAIYCSSIDVVKLLIDNKADVNLCGIVEQAYTPLTAASEKGDLDMIHLLLKNNADVNKSKGITRTPLTAAVISNHIDVVQLFLENKADVNLCSDGDEACTPLIAACLRGFEDIIQLLLKYNVDVDKLNKTGRTALTESVFEDSIELVQLLVDHEADVNLCGIGDQAYTPLTAACQSGSLDIIHLLLKYNANINHFNGLGRTPLTDAILGHHIDVIQLLLNNKINVNKVDINLCGVGDQAHTPLTAASEKGFVNIANLLLKYNSDVNKLNGNGRTPLTCAVLRNHIDLVYIFLQLNVDVNLCGEDGKAITPLIAACFSGLESIADVLLRRGAEINQMSGQGQTPLTYSVFKNRTNMINFLLSRNADVNMCGDNKHAVPSLTAACITGSVYVTCNLLKHGAIVNKCDGLGLPPLVCSVIGNHIDIAKLLVRHGALIDHEAKVKETYKPLFIAFKNYNVSIIRILLNH